MSLRMKFCCNLCQGQIIIMFCVQFHPIQYSLVLCPVCSSCLWYKSLFCWFDFEISASASILIYPNVIFFNELNLVPKFIFCFQFYSINWQLLLIKIVKRLFWKTLENVIRFKVLLKFKIKFCQWNFCINYS